ncbi:MAG TPA: hypothetical protein VGD74_06995, partial [Vulgatibacter sp.]
TATGKRAFDSTKAGWTDLGWRPEGTVYFSYAVDVAADGQNFTSTATTNLDGDADIQCWLVQMPKNDAAKTVQAPNAAGCSAVASKVTQVHKASSKGDGTY